MVVNKLALIRISEDQKCHGVPFYPRWYPNPLLWCVIMNSCSWLAIVKTCLGQEQGYTGSGDPFNREA